MAILLLILGLIVAVNAHLAIRIVERRARRAYEELVGEEAASSEPDDAWKGIRAVVGGWGCLLTLLEFVRGVGVCLALGAGLYLVIGQES